jgi:hypothetical protein
MKTPQKKLNSKKNEKLKKFIVSLNASKLPPNNFKSPTHCKKALNNNETQRNSETRGRKVPRRAREQQSTMQQQCMKEE